MSRTTLAQKLFVHGGVYAVSRLLNQGVGFLLLPVLGRYLGPEGYGVFSLATTVAGIVSIVLLQGVPGAWFRLRFGQTDADKHAFDSLSVWYVIVSLVVGIAAMCAVGPYLAERWLPGVPFFPILLLALVVEACVELVALFQRRQQAEQKPVRFLVVALVRNVASLGSALLFVAVLERHVRGRFEGELLAVGALSLGLLLHFRPVAPWKVDWSQLKPVLIYGLPLIPHQLAGVVNQAIDRPLINSYVGLAEAGLYSMSYKVASIGFIVSMALNQALTSLVYDALRGYDELPQSERELRAREVRKSGLYLTSAVAACLLGVAAIGRETLVFMASEKFEAAWRLLPLLCAGMLLLSIYQPLANMLIYFKRVRWLPVATIGAAAVNIVLNIVLLPRIGVIGAAWATLLSNLVLILTVTRLTADLFRVYDWPKVIGVGACTAVGLAGFFVLDTHVALLWVRLACKLGVLVVVVFGLKALVGVRFADLKALLRKRKRTSNAK